jgi:hypothetical protein
VSWLRASTAGAYWQEVHINFQPYNAPVPAGYKADWGQPGGGNHGWEDFDGNPIHFKHAVRRSGVSDERDATTMIVRTHESADGRVSAVWRLHALEYGQQYRITMGVGDAVLRGNTRVVLYQCSTALPPCPRDSAPIVLVNGFVGTVSQPFLAVTTTFVRAGGDIYLSADPGLDQDSNGRWDFIDIVPVSG